jgi:hypothetical protein
MKTRYVCVTCRQIYRALTSDGRAAGLLSILESGQNRGPDLTSPEGQRTEWPGGDVTGEDTALDYDPDGAFGLFFPAEEGNSELERPVDQRPRIAPAQRFQRHRSQRGSTRCAPSCLRNITAVVLVGGAIADELHAAGETTQALEALLTVALGCWWGNPDQTTRNRVVAVANRLAPPDEPALLSVLALADPVNRGRGVLERLRQAVAPDSGNPLAMFHLAKARAFGRTTWPSRFSRRPSTASAPTGRLGLVAKAHVSRACAAVHVPDARVATPAAAEGGRLSEETGQPRWAASAKLAPATMAAERGDAAWAEELTVAAERVLVPMGATR